MNAKKMRKTIVAGNWKMNASKDSVESLVTDILSGASDVSAEIIVCAPFPYLSQVEVLIEGSNLMLGAQNLNVNASGAFTGEVSAEMIKDFGANHVIVGHSERRSLYGETSEIVAEKTKAAIDSGLTPILCLGESLDQRESGKTESVVSEQLNKVIKMVGIEAFNNIIVAYEPVWAIGTGMTATPEQAQSVHMYIRALLATSNEDIAEKTPILYGGSMNAGNAAELISRPDIDGGLIGGAALKAEDFLKICKAG
jgi:triosephosphate isomerase